jgi:hypothetical protein
MKHLKSISISAHVPVCPANIAQKSQQVQYATGVVSLVGTITTIILSVYQAFEKDTSSGTDNSSPSA